MDFLVSGEEDGPEFFKILVSKCHIDTSATVSYLRESLATLDDYMAKVNSNVVQFHEHVGKLTQSLEARGEVTSDSQLIVDVMKG